MILRTQFECEILLYDVWDNRSFDQFKNYCKKLSDPTVRQFIKYEETPLKDVLESLIECSNFEEAYDIVGFSYLVDHTGLLNGVKNHSFDLLVSNTVFEHLKYEDIDTIIKRTYKVLKPGGWAIHLV